MHVSVSCKSKCIPFSKKCALWMTIDIPIDATVLFLVFSRCGIILNNLSFAFNGNVCNHELFLGATE